MHVDGSAMASLFFLPDLIAILPTPLEPLHGGHLYVLINGPIRAATGTTREQTFAILKRSAVATLQGGTRAAIEIAYSVAQRHRMGIAVADVPDIYPFSGALEFAAPRMRALFDYGERCALNDALWSAPIDALDQPPVQVLPPSADAVTCAGAVRPGPLLEAASIPPELPQPLGPIPKEVDVTLSDGRAGSSGASGTVRGERVTLGSSSD
jgi:hypothetical protein